MRKTMLTALALPVLSGLVLSSCHPVVMGGVAAYGGYEYYRFTDPDLNLKGRNYAAADYIIAQADSFLDDEDVIMVMQLASEEDAQVTSDIGFVISHDIAERLIQLGYRVDVSALKGNVTSLPKTFDFALVGSYLQDRNDLYVSLRIERANPPRTIGIFNYMMPTNKKMRGMAKPEPQIMKQR